MIGALALLTLIAAGTGGGLGLALVDQVEDAVITKQTTAEKPVASDYTGPTHLESLPPIVTNLAAPAETWIRLESSIVFAEEAVSGDEVLAGEITEDILAYLRTLTLAQVDGPSGMQFLREDLGERVRTRSGGRVSELVIRGLILQ
jgi:flagellar FliL protein